MLVFFLYAFPFVTFPFLSISSIHYTLFCTARLFPFASAPSLFTFFSLYFTTCTVYLISCPVGVSKVIELEKFLSSGGSPNDIRTLLKLECSRAEIECSVEAEVNLDVRINVEVDMKVEVEGRGEAVEEGEVVLKVDMTGDAKAKAEGGGEGVGKTEEGQSVRTSAGPSA